MVDVIAVFFFLIPHFDELFPLLFATYIVRQHDAVVKRKVFIADDRYFILCIDFPKSLDKAKGTRSSTDDYNAFKPFLIRKDLHGTKFKIRFFGDRVEQWIGKIVCPM